MPQVEIQLPDTLYQDLKRIASDRDCTVAELLRQAAELYVRRFTPPPREKSTTVWHYPEPLDLGGDFLIAPEKAE